MKRINDEHLEVIQKQQKELNLLLNNIGYYEAQKHGMLHQFNDLSKQVDEFKKVLEKEYGEVNINVETGEYTLVEQPETQSELSKVE
jgi:MoaA/NifB/PqqE/SkfB family radical SAM enzyme